MPAKSQSQREWAFGVKGPAWSREHHFDNPGKLPQYVNAQQGLNTVPPPPPGAAPPAPNPGLSLFRKMLAARAIGAKSKAGVGKPRQKPVTPPLSMPF